MRGLAAANSWRVRPLIVIPPLSPRLLAAVRPYGWEEHHREVLDMLASLQQRYRFDIADMSTINTFGGTPNAFYDAVHMRPKNAARLTEALAARYRDDL
jgi:lysophospholipase L1-like esterase